MAEVDFNIKIKGIEIMETHLVAKPPDFIDTAIDFHLESGKAVTEETNYIRLNVSIAVKEMSKNLILGAIAMGIGFEVPELNKYIVKNEKSLMPNYDINPALDYELDIIAIHTLRGIMFSYFKGTYLYKAILPNFSFMDKQKPIG